MPTWKNLGSCLGMSIQARRGDFSHGVSRFSGGQEPPEIAALNFTLPILCGRLCFLGRIAEWAPQNAPGNQDTDY